MDAFFVLRKSKELKQNGSSWKHHVRCVKTSKLLPGKSDLGEKVTFWPNFCNIDDQKEGARGAPWVRRPVKQCYADCLTNTPSQPLPLTLESDEPAAAPNSHPKTSQKVTPFPSEGRS